MGAIGTRDDDKQESMHDEYIPPWQKDILIDWSIVGMNHYTQDGEKLLFVSMEKNGFCIKAEGSDNNRLWGKLRQLAFDHDHCW